MKGKEKIQKARVFLCTQGKGARQRLSPPQTLGHLHPGVETPTHSLDLDTDPYALLEEAPQVAGSGRGLTIAYDSPWTMQTPSRDTIPRAQISSQRHLLPSVTAISMPFSHPLSQAAWSGPVPTPAESSQLPKSIDGDKKKSGAPALAEGC